MLFRDYSSRLPDSVKYALLNIKQANHGKLFEYKEAYRAISEMINKYSNLVTTEKSEDLKNTELIWSSLARQPPQVMIIKDNTDIKMKRDKEGLANLTVTHGTDSVDFIFDTGANLSTITESTAKKLQVTIVGSGIDVASVTGKNIKSKIGICPLINIGNITVENAVFLVFPDSALAIPQIQFQINGIIGFPVIEAMKEVQITQNNEFIVPAQRTTHHIQNMALDFLTPIICLDGDSYTFDTGADYTMLYELYFRKYKKQIEGNYKKLDLRFAGAGGDRIEKGYKIPFKAMVEGKPFIIDSVMVFSKNIKETENYFYGNIGQDLIKQFKKMTLNFESMFIRFE